MFYSSTRKYSKNIAPHSVFQFDRDTISRRLVLLCAIILSGGNLLIPRFPILAILALTGILAFGFLSLKINRRDLVIYIWLGSVISISIAWSLNSDLNAVLVRLINFLAALVVLQVYIQRNSRVELADDLKSILLPMAYIGILTFGVATLFPAAFTEVMSGPQRMFTLGGVLNYAPTLFSSSFSVRPIAIFWEPGVYAAFLNILLFILLSKGDKYAFIFLTALSIVLTQSTTGIIILFIQIFYFLTIKVMRRNIRVSEIVFVILSLAAIPMLFNIGQENIVEKLTGAASGSFSARQFDFDTALQVIKENPILGIGFSESAYLPYSRYNPLAQFVLSQQDLYGRYNTNGLMIVIYSIGIPLAIIYLGAIFLQPFFSHKFLFGFIVIIILASSPLSMTPFFSFLFFSGLRVEGKSFNEALKI